VTDTGCGRFISGETLKIAETVCRGVEIHRAFAHKLMSVATLLKSAGPTLCLMVSVAVMLVDVRAQLTEGVRRISPLPGVSLESRLSASDRIVEVYFAGGEPLVVEADAERTLEILRASDSVIVATVTDTKSSLTPDGSWVRTRLSVNVRDVLLTRRPGLVERGKPLTCDIDGGELIVKGVVVRAGYLDILRTGQDYLLGVGSCAKDGCEARIPLHVTPTGHVELPDQSPSGAPAGGATLKAMTLEQVTSALRKGEIG
jgi:hypothetical protein